MKTELEKIMLENLQLMHRLSCIKDDIEIVNRHINNNCPEQFAQPSLNEDGSVYADAAIQNVSNIEIACDFSDESVNEWGSGDAAIINSIIATLNSIEVDGETMQYILRNTGMNEQMLKQLMVSL